MVFATAAQGRALLLRADDYVRATLPLERRMHLHSREPVSQDAFMRYQAGLVREWPAKAREALLPALERLQAFLQLVRAQWPERVLMVRIDQRLDGGAAFTRGNGIFVFDEALATPDSTYYFLAHEAFHVLSRHNPALREKLYAMLGFERCTEVEIPPEVGALRLTNPDAVENVHTIRVRLRGEQVHALPFNRFKSADVTPMPEFFSQVENRWLLVDRDGGRCKVRRTAQGVPDVEPEDLEGLFEQVGRNTEYLFHPEEILADNFALLFMQAGLGRRPDLPSPQLLEKLRAALFPRPN